MSQARSWWEHKTCANGEYEKMNPKTYSAKLDDLDPRWYIVDAENKVLGRLATEIAQVSARQISSQPLPRT